VKIDLRWQLLIVAVCLAFVAFLLSNQEQTSVDCAITTVSSSGRLREGIVGLPQYINPLLSDRNPVDQQLVDLIFDGLVRYDQSGVPVPALADTWSFSEDNTTITFTLDTRKSWHDGQPVTSEDVAFSYSLLQNDSFPVDAALRSFWQAVSIDVVDETQISFTLPQPFTPFLQAVTRGILPSHVLGDVPVSDLVDHEFNQAPIGTGPFFVEPGTDWRDDGHLELHPYPNHWREGTRLEAIEFRFYEDASALKEAYLNSEIDAITVIPAAEINVIGSLPGLRLYTSPKEKVSEIIFNMTDSANAAFKSAPVRKALAYGLDRDALSDQILVGQSVPLEGPFLPSSFAYNPSLLTDYTYQPEQAASLLDSEGWLMAENSTGRVKDGERLTLRLLSSNEAVQTQIAQTIASQWANMGVSVDVETVSLVNFPDTLLEREYDVALLDISPLNDPDLYDFWSQEAIIRGQNYGGWNNRRASEALEFGRRLPTTDERRPFYEAFLKYFDADLPALTLFQYVESYGIRGDVLGVSIGPVNQPRDRYQDFDQWSFDLEEKSVICPESTPGTGEF
jgi:peptide/nickel transport system substrate-binding protein